jgi:hypothetical protein
MFIVALSTIAKLWTQLRCPKANEWLIKIYIYTYTMEYYSSINKNEMMSFTRKWTELEIIILSEIIQAEEDKHCMFSFIFGA